MAPTHRVSYVIPPPSAPVPTLTLPPPGISRNGQTRPLLLPSPSPSPQPSHRLHPDQPPTPKHRLPVSALALDTTTTTSHSTRDGDKPGGILYSGGRDGLLMAWDLHLPMKPRASRYGARAAFARGNTSSRVGRWDVLTRDEDDENAIYEEDDDDHWPHTSDGDVLGDVPNSAGGRGRHYFVDGDEIPFEQKWEFDLAEYEPGQVWFICHVYYELELELMIACLYLVSASLGMETRCTGSFRLGQRYVTL